MSYNAYTPTSLNKDFYEEYNGNDLIIRYTNSTGLFDYISEADIRSLNLRPPSDKLGVAIGAPYDIFKIYLPASRYTGNTSTLFGDLELSPLRTELRSSIVGSFFGKINYGTLTAPIYWCGKVLRVDFIPLSDGSSLAGVVITFASYI